MRSRSFIGLTVALAVVLVAGSDYFRFDSPVLRTLLPISAPRLEPLGTDGQRGMIAEAAPSGQSPAGSSWI